MEKRPKILIKPEKTDLFFEWVSRLALIAIFALTLWHYNALPDQVPSHFAVDGSVDSYSSKHSIWFIPVITLLLFVGLSWLNQYPHKFNYIKPITEKNAHKQYIYATKLVRGLKSSITLIFLYIHYAAIRTALGSSNGLGSAFLPLILVVTTLMLVVYLFKAGKEKH